MFDRIRILSTVAALSIAVVSTPATAAEQSSRINLPTIVGAMNENAGLARSADEVRRQGGFMTAGAVRWLSAAPGQQQAAINVPTVIGALGESRTLARDAAGVRAQGGFMTAGAVRWLDAPAVEEAKGPVTVGSL